MEDGVPGAVFGKLSYLSASDLTLSPSNPLPPTAPTLIQIKEGITAPSPVTIARESTPLPTPIPNTNTNTNSNGLAPPAQLPIAPPSPVVEREVTPEPEVVEEEGGEEENGASGSVSPATGGSRTPSKKNKKKKKPAKK